MPYIKKESRKFWNSKLGPLLETIHKNTEAGRINYIITKILLKWIKGNLKYESLCKVAGTLVCVLLEFYRRIGGSYEDRKILMSGDLEEFKDIYDKYIRGRKK